MSARRYLVVIQDQRGYPSRDDPLEPAPPDGPAQPMIRTAVLEEDYEALEAKVERLTKALDAVLTR